MFKESSDFITLWVADFGGRVEEAEGVEAQELRQELCAGVQRPQGSGLGHRQRERVEEAASGCFRENSGKCLGFGAQ